MAKVKSSKKTTGKSASKATAKTTAKTATQATAKPMAKNKNVAPKKTTRGPVIPIGVVTARFNTEITSKLRDGAERIIDLRNEAGANYEVWSVEVPGAVEIALAVQTLLEKGCHGVVALGTVIRGETPHFEYVNQSVERALTELILDFNSPIGFGVLTVENWDQAEERVGGKHGHKGEEAAEAVLEMIELTAQIRQAESPAQVGRPKAKLVTGSAKAKLALKE